MEEEGFCHLFVIMCVLLLFCFKHVFHIGSSSDGYNAKTCRSNDGNNYGVMLGMESAGGRRFWNGVGKYSIVGICLFEITTFVNKQ